MNKKIILIISALVIIIGGVFAYRGFVQEKPLDFVLKEVFRGDVYQEVVETGVIQAGEKIDLSFKNASRIEELNVGVGDLVEEGQVLAKIDIAQLLIQLNEAKAGLNIAETGLVRLKAGASREEIAVTETAIKNLEKQLTGLEKTSAQRISQAKSSTEIETKQANERGLNTLINNDIIIYNAFRVVTSVQGRYFITADQEGIRVRNHKDIIENVKKETRFYLEIARNNSTDENISTALLRTRQGLEIISDSLRIIRETCDVSIYRHIVSDVDRSLLDGQRTHIATALNNIISAQQARASAQLLQENLKVLESEADFQLTQIKGQLNAARRQLELVQAEPRQVDIDLHQAQIDQVKARKNLLQKQIEESNLRAPIEGKITEVFQKKGETAQPMKPVISLLPTTPFQIEVEIYEEDIAKIKIGNPVEINLIPFPDKTFRGKVISINPTETIIGGVVYYETTIAFIEELPEGVRPGMTADIIIQTVFKENVLVISENAIKQRDDKFIVEVFKDGIIEEREIKIGLKGEDNRVEIISGLKEGEQVVIR
jgi:RND family efflux transporter MFP subunit